MITYQYRIKDASTAKYLQRHASAVNFVWNFCVATQKEAERRRKSGLNVYWPKAFDLIKLCTGASRELGLHSDTVQTICREFVARRDAIKRCPRWRSYKKNLGWIPFINRAVRVRDAKVYYFGRYYRFWNSRDIDGILKSGSFRCDARGRWYVNFSCEIEVQEPSEGPSVGIDLGLKELATLSDGTKIEAPRLFRKYEQQLAIAQRANNKKRAKAIHAKITNARKHFLHEHSTKLVRKYGHIVVGNVNASQLARTRMAKSVLDAGWSAFRNMLAYKAIQHGRIFEEADERFSSVTCSTCKTRSGPQGQKGLRVRQWVCSCCGSEHDRDHNAAINILSAGAERRPLVGEILVL